MRVKKSDIRGLNPGIFDRSDEILGAIKGIKLDPVVVEQKIPDEIIEQQKAMIAQIEALSAPKDFPSYHFQVNRTSDGFIKSVDATPVDAYDVEQRNIEVDWYKGK